MAGGRLKPMASFGREIQCSAGRLPSVPTGIAGGRASPIVAPSVGGVSDTPA